jgi:hypothetical protein
MTPFPTIEISAVGDSNQRADADSNNYGIIAGGGNTADVTSNVQTNAYLGSEVTIGAGDAIGGLTDGGLYYVVVDDRRPFIPSVDTIDLTADTIMLGSGHGLQTGDIVVYIKGIPDDEAIGGLNENQSYRVEVDSIEPSKIRLRDVTECAYPSYFLWHRL